MTLTRIHANDARLADVLALIQTSLAYMDGVIDPPSSMHRLTLASLKATCTTAEIWAMTNACMILTPKDGTLYLGKLAVDPAARGKGLARLMVAHAITRAIALGKPTITLETRIELRQNHSVFRAFGFVETARTAHPGYARPTSLTFVRTI